MNRELNLPDPEPSGINHKGANEFRQEIGEYLNKVKSLGCMAGLYAQYPFKNITSRIGISPLNSTEKRDSDKRRIIIDFSWPIGRSVNYGINKDLYLDTPINLRYPMIDTLAERVVQIGVGVALFKKDLVGAFRQLMTDPFDYSLMTWMGRAILGGSGRSYGHDLSTQLLSKGYGQHSIHSSKLRFLVNELHWWLHWGQKVEYCIQKLPHA